MPSSGCYFFIPPGYFSIITFDMLYLFCVGFPACRTLSFKNSVLKISEIQQEPAKSEEKRGTIVINRDC
jgi:hypothetical protein